jgi:hypothetical protein
MTTYIVADRILFSGWRLSRDPQISGETHMPKLIDEIADAAMPKTDISKVSERSKLWWIFILPGKVILWIEYMFPRRVSGAFGSARRRNIPLLQLVYSIGFYFALLVLIAIAMHG